MRSHRPLALLPASVTAFLLLSLSFILAACSGGSKTASPTPTVAIGAPQAGAVPTVAVPVTAAAVAPSQAAPVQTPPATAPAANSIAAAAPSAFATPTLPPPPDPAPCRDGQIKGNSSTHVYYMPGMIGYSSLHNNVQCFNTMDEASGAGYKLPTPGG